MSDAKSRKERIREARRRIRAEWWKARVARRWRKYGCSCGKHGMNDK